MFCCRKNTGTSLKDVNISVMCFHGKLKPAWHYNVVNGHKRFIASV